MKYKKLKLISLLFVLVLFLVAALPTLTFAEDTIPDWLREQLENERNGVSSSTGGAQLIVGEPTVPKPPAPPVTSAPPPVTTAPPAVAPASEPVSSAAPIPSRELPPPPSVENSSEWVYGDGSTISMTSENQQLPRMDIAVKPRRGATEFFAENWWWIVGGGLLLIGIITLVIYKRNQNS